MRWKSRNDASRSLQPSDLLPLERQRTEKDPREQGYREQKNPKSAPRSRLSRSKKPNFRRFCPYIRPKSAQKKPNLLHPLGECPGASSKTTLISNEDIEATPFWRNKRVVWSTRDASKQKLAASSPPPQRGLVLDSFEINWLTLKRI